MDFIAVPDISVYGKIKRLIIGRFLLRSNARLMEKKKY